MTGRDPEDKLSRSEAIRRLVERALATEAKANVLGNSSQKTGSCTARSGDCCCAGFRGAAGAGGTILVTRDAWTSWRPQWYTLLGYALVI
jgi:hypothetical protein